MVAMASFLCIYRVPPTEVVKLALEELVIFCMTDGLKFDHVTLGLALLCWGPVYVLVLRADWAPSF